MKVLLTGATGYIGRRLLYALVEAKHEIVCLVRNPQRLDLPAPVANQVQVIAGDLLADRLPEDLPRDIDAAYYLVHSPSQAGTDFVSLEQRSARNFTAYLKSTSARQVIYLGGLSHGRDLSRHFQSRQAVAETLAASAIPTTVFRAGIIIGSGSASFEIIRDLVEKLPVMIAPRWVETRCQPIAIRDVLYYLTAALGNQDTFGRSFDIGGPDILTYRQMLLQFAEIRQLRRLIIPVPVLTPRLSSYWLYFVTGVNFPLARTLVDSMKNEAICREREIEAIVPHQCLTYRKAVQLAFQRIDQRTVLSSWKDAWISGRLEAVFPQYTRVPEHGCLVDEQAVSFAGPCEQILDRLWTIGGAKGWYYANVLWWLRGLADKAIGGVGLRRGRTSPEALHPGDALDFWRVLLADRKAMRLLLYAEMRLPGEAWLEFRVVPGDRGSILKQRAVFRPRGLWGRLYWYALWPLHIIIFRGMINRIALKD